MCTDNLADAVANVNPVIDTDRNTHADAYNHPDEHIHVDAHIHADFHGDSVSDGDEYAHTHADTHVHGDGDADAHIDPDGHADTRECVHSIRAPVPNPLLRHRWPKRDDGLRHSQVAARDIGNSRDLHNHRGHLHDRRCNDRDAVCFTVSWARGGFQFRRCTCRQHTSRHAIVRHLHEAVLGRPSSNADGLPLDLHRHSYADTDPNPLENADADRLAVADSDTDAHEDLHTDRVTDVDVHSDANGDLNGDANA